MEFIQHNPLTPATDPPIRLVTTVMVAVIMEAVIDRATVPVIDPVIVPVIHIPVQGMIWGTMVDIEAVIRAMEPFWMDFMEAAQAVVWVLSVVGSVVDMEGVPMVDMAATAATAATMAMEAGMEADMEGTVDMVPVVPTF